MNQDRIQDLSFLGSTDILDIAQNLLGYRLVTNFKGKRTAGIIVETEAYKGPEDKGSHAFNNRRTKRTEVMFGPSGHAYVYLCYGIHHMFNFVSGPKEIPHAILVRAIEPVDGISEMMERRGFKKLKPQLTAGPGVLCKALGIRTDHTGIDLSDKKSPIWIEPKANTSFQITRSPRVGIDYAAEWKDKPWRFRIKNNPYCSPAK